MWTLGLSLKLSRGLINGSELLGLVASFHFHAFLLTNVHSIIHACLAIALSCNESFTFSFQV